MATATTESSILANLLKQPSYAQRLALQASSTEPTPSWGAGLARALMGGVAGLSESGDRAQRLADFDAQYGAAQPGGTPPVALPSMAPRAEMSPAVAPQRLASALSSTPSPTPPADLGPMDGPATRQGGTTIGSVLSMEPPPYHADEHPLDSMRPPQDKIRLALANALGGNAASDAGSGTSPVAPQSPAPQAAAQPPVQQMAQAAPAQPPQNLPQAPAQRVAPQIPPDVLARARLLAGSSDPSGPARAAALLEPYTALPNYGFQAVGENLVRTDPRSGSAQVIPGLSPSKPSYGVIGKDQFGNDQYGFINPQDRQVTPGPYSKPPDGGSGSAAGAMGAQGQEFLDTLDKPLADQVKAIAEGRMGFPSGFALRTPYWQRMIQMVGQYDPTFDAVNYNARAKTRQDFTSGKSAQSINAMNTVAGHLETLSDAADKLNNTSIPGYNTVANWLSSATGDPRIKQFDATKKAVVDELTRVWRGGGGSEGDIKTWAGAIDAAGSPEQLHGVIGQIGDLIQSKIGAMGEQYKQGMGTTAAPIQLVTPKAQGVFDKLRERAYGGAAGQGAQQSPPAGGNDGWKIEKVK